MADLHTLANILVDPSAAPGSPEGLYLRHTARIDRCGPAGFLLPAHGEFDFCTYYNALSIGKWKRYSCARSFVLELRIEGSFTLALFELGGQAGDKAPLGEPADYSCDGKEPLRIAIPETQAPLVGFGITTKTDCSLGATRYGTFLGDVSARPVRLAVVMTTFRNEDYLAPNIRLFNGILDGSDPLAQGLEVHIVDNGQTLDPKEYARDRLHVYANSNAGGAGGFARGIIEALGTDPRPTHVILMDDDVSVSPESLKRTCSLLQLVSDEYLDACLSGAMLKLDSPYMQHEDVGRVLGDGRLAPVKPTLDMSSLGSLPQNETIPVELPHVYGAWWYYCIPAAVIDQHGLPLPFFVRCDDVEYGMRTNPTIMTMNGINVWHASFETRFRASVDYYQHYRNFLITNALSRCCSERSFMLRYRRCFCQELNSFGYDNAELLLDALEDYLAGPAFIEQDRGAAILVEKGSKNEKLLPFDEIEAAIGIPIAGLYHAGSYTPPEGRPLPGNVASRFLAAFRFDPHRKRDEALDDTPVAVLYDGQSILDRKTQGAARLVAVNEFDRTAALRSIDRGRYRRLRQRYRSLIKRHRAEGARVAASYRAALPRLGSVAFWRVYLGLSQT